MKGIIQYILKILSKMILWKYRPEVVGITGSVGKTSAKNAIALVLGSKFKVRASEGNYNTEIGAPLSIIGVQNPGKSLFGWLRVCFKGLGLILKKDKNYPNVLVLEMAADYPGDIKYLVEFVKPKVGVITSVAPTHLEFFENIESVLEEKSNMVKLLEGDKWAILNADDERVAGLESKTDAKIVSYGLGDNVLLKATNIAVDKEKGGIRLQFEYGGSYVPVFLPNVLGKPGIYASLAAAGVGIAYGINLINIGERLKEIRPMHGRLNMIGGIKHTRIIDDTYNSSPIAVKAGLEILSHLSCNGEKWAILGDMLELGNYTEKAHREAGEDVVRAGVDYLVCVGEASADTARAAEEYGMNSDRVFKFDKPAEAGRFIQDEMKEGDLLLVKGSRGVEMEKVVKEIMAEPGKADKILVRQYEMWKKK